MVGPSTSPLLPLNVAMNPAITIRITAGSHIRPMKITGATFLAVPRPSPSVVRIPSRQIARRACQRPWRSPS